MPNDNPTESPKNEGLPELLTRLFKHVSVSLLIGMQIFVVVWIAGVSLTERSPELACAYAAAAYLAIFTYLFQEWRRKHE